MGTGSLLLGRKAFQTNGFLYMLQVPGLWENVRCISRHLTRDLPDGGDDLVQRMLWQGAYGYEGSRTVHSGSDPF